MYYKKITNTTVNKSKVQVLPSACQKINISKGLKKAYAADQRIRHNSLEFLNMSLVIVLDSEQL
jgi:hypothetical protein